MNCITDDNISSAAMLVIYTVCIHHTKMLAVTDLLQYVPKTPRCPCLASWYVNDSLYHNTSPPRQFSAPNSSIICSIAYSPLELDKYRLRFHYSMSFCVGICWVRYMYLICKYLWKCLMVYCNELQFGWCDFELYLFDTNARVVHQYRSCSLYTHVDCVWYSWSGICDIV